MHLARPIPRGTIALTVRAIAPLANVGGHVCASEGGVGDRRADCRKQGRAHRPARSIRRPPSIRTLPSRRAHRAGGRLMESIRSPIRLDCLERHRPACFLLTPTSIDRLPALIRHGTQGRKRKEGVRPRQEGRERGEETRGRRSAEGTYTISSYFTYRIKF